MRNIIKDKYRKNIFEHRIKQEAERTEHQDAGKRKNHSKQKEQEK